MRTELRSSVGDGTAGRYKSRAGHVVSAVVISSTLGLILPAQVASSQTLDGSSVTVRPNVVRPATRQRTPQLSAEDTAAGDPRTRSHLPTANSQLPTRPLAELVRSALQDARFREVLGTQLNSPVIDGATIGVPPEQLRPARRRQAPQLTAKDVTVDANAPRHETPTLDVRKELQAGARTALHDARFGEAMARGGTCVPWGCGENSPVVEGAAVTGPDSSHAARRHRTSKLTAEDVVVDRQGADNRRASAMPDVRNVSTSPGARVVLQHTHFAEAWGRNLNSSVVDGAAIGRVRSVFPSGPPGDGPAI
jgi:hypothetical protein